MLRNRNNKLKILSKSCCCGKLIHLRNLNMRERRSKTGLCEDKSNLTIKLNYQFGNTETYAYLIKETGGFLRSPIDRYPLNYACSNLVFCQNFSDLRACLLLHTKTHTHTKTKSNEKLQQIRFVVYFNGSLAKSSR